MRRGGLLLIVVLMGAVAGCAANNYEARPFFQHEYGVETHGRKTLLDRIVETDPGGFKVYVSPGYFLAPPERLAVLPFEDLGSANFVVDKIALTDRGRQQRFNWAWTDSQRLRRAMQGYLSQREFVMANLIGVDAVLKSHGIKTPRQLYSLAPQQLGRWLGVDAVVYGKVLNYDGYYLFLVAAWHVGIEVRIVSTHTGQTLIHATGNRYDVQVLPAIDIQDMAINSLQNLLQLRDINLARSEEEACREVVLRIPVSAKLEELLAQQAVAQPPDRADPKSGAHPVADSLPDLRCKAMIYGYGKRVKQSLCSDETKRDARSGTKAPARHLQAGAPP